MELALTLIPHRTPALAMPAIVAALALAACGTEQRAAGSVPDAPGPSTAVSNDLFAAEPTAPATTPPDVTDPHETTDGGDITSTPVDEYPSDWYEIKACPDPIATEPGVPLDDRDTTPLGIAEIVRTAPVIGRFRVASVAEPILFVPSGLSSDQLGRMGAQSATDLALGATPVTLETIEPIAGLSAGERREALLLGCWKAGGTDLFTSGAQVVVLGFEPPANRGISPLIGNDLRIFAWYTIADDELLQAGADLAQNARISFGALDGQSYESVVNMLRAESQG